MSHSQKEIAVIGLGYVGLPLALAFAKKFPVIGFDINETRIGSLQMKADPNQEIAIEDFANANIVFTSNAEEIKRANVFIITVPTPIDENKKPDLKFLLDASSTVGSCLKTGDVVIYESTVFPGCTEENCVPVLEQLSGLKGGIDFKIAYSPERINPGDRVHKLANTVKIVSASDDATLDLIANLYEEIVTAGVYRAPNIRTAEAAKILENTQRDLNIALMNEMSRVFDAMNVNTFEAIDAAATKWNFQKFYPGLVGGHCIGVDPYYLIHQARQKNVEPKLVEAGRFVNDGMGLYVAEKTIAKIRESGKNIKESKVLILGFTIKENVTDIRNTKIADIVTSLEDQGLCVDLMDPFADAGEVEKEYHFQLKKEIGSAYDAVIVAVAHDVYKSFTEKDFLEISSVNPVLMDVKGVFRGKIKEMSYWSL